jgi:hypothetical protein
MDPRVGLDRVKSLCLTKHHAINTYWGIVGVAPRNLDLGTRWRWVVSFTPRPLYPQGKSPRYPLDRRRGGPQSRSGCGGEEKIPSPRRESNPRTPIVQPVAQRYTDWGGGGETKFLPCSCRRLNPDCPPRGLVIILSDLPGNNPEVQIHLYKCMEKSTALNYFSSMHIEPTSVSSILILSSSRSSGMICHNKR